VVTYIIEPCHTQEGVMLHVCSFNSNFSSLALCLVHSFSPVLFFAFWLSYPLFLWLACSLPCSLSCSFARFFCLEWATYGSWKQTLQHTAIRHCNSTLQQQIATTLCTHAGYHVLHELAWQLMALVTKHCNTLQLQLLL